MIKWSVSRLETKKRGIDIIDDFGIVASVYLSPYVDHAREARKNARLIAAAPELYEALEAADAAMEAMSPGGTTELTDAETARLWNAAREKVAAALAKARGETS